MSKAERVRRIYQCDLSEEFRNVSEQRSAQKEWERATSHMRSRSISMLPDVWAAVSWLKSKLSKPGVVLSLPGYLFTSATVGRTVAQEINQKDLNPWIASCEAIREETQMFDVANLPNTVFFECVNAYPEKQFSVKVHHVDKSKDEVQIIQRIHAGSDISRGAEILVCDARSHGSLFLVPLVVRMKETLSSFFVWNAFSWGMGMGVRQLPEPIQPAGDSISVPTASSVLARHAGSDEAAASSTSSVQQDVLALKSLPDTVASNALISILLSAERTGSDVVPFQEIEDVHMDNLQTLAQAGAVILAENDFGELAVSVNKSMLRYFSRFLVRTPQQVMRVDAYSGTCKSDMAMALIRGGWTGRDSLDAPFKHGGPLLFVCHSRRPNSYFTCLLQKSKLFAKGISEIPHDWKDWLCNDSDQCG